MSCKSVPCLATARFIMACSFIATMGPGSATSVLTSTRAPFEGTTSMVTASVAVSLAQAWAEAWRRSPGSSLGWSISIWRTSRTSTMTRPYGVGSNTEAGSTGSAPCAAAGPEVAVLRQATYQRHPDRWLHDRAGESAHYGEAADNDTDGCPISVRTSPTPWTTAAITSPTNVTRLPDTCPPVRRRPDIEDFASAPCVLGQVQRDEERVGEWPFERVGCEVDSVTACCRHRYDPQRAQRAPVTAMGPRREARSLVVRSPDLAHKNRGAAQRALPAAPRRPRRQPSR